MASQNLLRIETCEEPRKSLARSADVLSKFFREWAVIFPNHPTGAQAVACYLEALRDLNPDQIEAGCKEAIKVAQQFPKPGHIRAAVPVTQNIFLGPRQLTYPEVSKEDREAALEYSAALRRQLGIGREPTAAKMKTIPVPSSSVSSIEEQKEILRRKGYL